jgi:hypothetical protein
MGSVAGTSGDTSQPNVHAAWRMAEARRAAQAYQPNPKLAALAVGGSVGSGLADQFSDLEVDCYWFSAPGDQDRTDPIRALGGDLTALWDYDQDEEEWSEDYRLGELDVTVSNFLTGTIERFLDQVVQDADTDPVKHMRLAALQRSHPLLGAELMASWRSWAGGYPDELVSAMVERALNPRVLASWAAREALVARGDDLAVQALLSGIGYAVVGAVLALNRVYLPHSRLKWQRYLIAGLEVAPGRLAERLELLSAARPAEALQAAEALLTDIVLLSEARTGADLGSFREELSVRRRAIGPPLG